MKKINCLIVEDEKEDFQKYIEAVSMYFDSYKHFRFFSEAINYLDGTKNDKVHFLILDVRIPDPCHKYTDVLIKALKMNPKLKFIISSRYGINTVKDELKGIFEDYNDSFYEKDIFIKNIHDILPNIVKEIKRSSN